MAIVVDASALIDVYVASVAASAIVARSRGEVLHAPVTVDAEVLHGLRRHLLSGSMSESLGLLAVDHHQRMVIRRHPVESRVARMWALRHNITAYDAAYVALAESLDLPLITRDRRLAHSSGHTARIEYVE